MEISELKQPYRRMAEYLEKINFIQQSGDGIYNFYKQGGMMDLFCNSMDEGSYQPITEEIKSFFPADFDFSGEEKNPLTEISITDLKPIDENLQKAIYTKLAKEGRFDELPDTCEFSEPVELLVWDDNNSSEILDISGKYKGFYMFIAENKDVISYINAQLPTPKIDFSDYKIGDVVEVDSKANGVYFGLICNTEKDFIKLSFNSKATTTTLIPKTEIISIKKLK